MTRLSCDSFLPSGSIDRDFHLGLPEQANSNYGASLILPLAPCESMDPLDHRQHLPISHHQSSPPTSAAQSIASAINTPGAAAQAQLTMRLVQQNRRVREAWEAERKYMEANRERAEEVYREECALMEYERADWEAEREALLRQIARLQRQVAAARPREDAIDGKHVLAGQGEEVVIQRGLQKSESDDDNKDPAPGALDWKFSRGNGKPIRSQQSGRSSGNTGGDWPRRDLPTTSSAAAVAVAVAVAPVPLQLHPTPSQPLLPLSPSRRSGSAHPLETSPDHAFPFHSESMTSSQQDPPPLPAVFPTVDVQEIIPSLEGIPIKATAIKKPTFTDNIPAPSPRSKDSRPTSPASSSSTPPPPPPLPKRNSEQQALRVLAADEAHRLTLHAGHTPTHPLSDLPTVATSSMATAATSSGNTTPTPHPNHHSDNTAAPRPSDLPPGPGHQATQTDHPEPVLVAADDFELQGPLMVRNVPAEDDVFFKCLSDKLEEVSKASDAAVPAVLKESLRPAGPSLQAKSRKEGGTDNVALLDDTAGNDKSNDDMEIPLKLRKSSNFGAPFGEIR